MKLRQKFLPSRLVDWLCFLVIGVFLPIVFVFEIIIVLPEFHEPWGILHTLTCVMSIFIVFNITGNLMACMLVDTSVDHKILKPPNNAVETHGWRHCSDCDQLSPPRSWHCKVCRSCILKRDHHCLFTGCCIGHKNHRYFFLFVLYLFMGATYAFVYNSLYIWVLRGSYYCSWLTALKMVCPMIMIVTGSTWDNTYIIFYNLNILALTYSLLLLVYQVPIIWRGSVCYEREKLNVNYDVGWRLNLRNVFGDRMHMVWLLPFIESELPIDGIDWKPKQPNKTADHIVKNKKIT